MADPIIARVIVRKQGQVLLMKRHKEGHNFFALPGGHIEQGESPEQAARRELLEETTVTVTDMRQVYLLTTKGYGSQVIFLGEHAHGNAMLDPESHEAQLTQEGDNTYEPVWVSYADLGETDILPSVLKERIVRDLQRGFSVQVQPLNEMESA